MPHLSIENLAALLGSRICHDLISPIGAISNGLELLSLSGVPDSPELALVADSASNASARIGLFRLAFGIATKDQITRRDEICKIWPNAMAGRRLDLNWHGPPSLPRPQAQLVVLALLCLDKATPQGGMLSVTEDDGHWSVTAQADCLKYEPELWGALTGLEHPDINPAHVQFYLLPHYLAYQAKRCEVITDESSLTIRF